MTLRGKKLSPISNLHFFKLFYRSALFLWAVVEYLYSWLRDGGGIFRGLENKYWLLTIVWIVYAVEMALRFFPSKWESMGCQKQFSHNYAPTGDKVTALHSWKSTLAVGIAWILLNGAIGGLYLAGLIDEDVLILISLAYGVCDMICILFFCPFQTWFMKNRCCASCRIYNWDFAMMFTPFLFIFHWYTWSLLLMSLIILARWELTAWYHPERMSEKSNACLSCQNCKEKLCHHKTQLIGFWRKNKIKIQAKIKAIKKSDEGKSQK